MQQPIANVHNFVFNNSNLDGYYFAFATHEDSSRTAPIYILLSLTPDFARVEKGVAPNLGKPLTFNSFSEGILDSLSVSLAPFYEAPLEVLDDQQINLNIEYVPDTDGDGAISQDELNGYIPAAIYAGDYHPTTPTYEITVVQDPSVDPDPAPGTGEDPATDSQLVLDMRNLAPACDLYQSG